MPELRGRQVQGMPVTMQPPFDRQSGAGDVAALHARQVAHLVAYLCSSDRHAGAREAEGVAGEAFLEVASTWPRIGGASSPEVYLFSCAHRIAVARSHLGHSGRGDAFAESMPAFGDQADLARLAVLQDALDQLPAAPRYAVLLREMCGFGPREGAEIIGLPEGTVELARDDALRILVPVVESGTAAVHARRGPLSPDDFAALSRVLQHPDADRLVERRHLSERLSGRSPRGAGPIPTGGVPLGRSTAGLDWDNPAGPGYPGPSNSGPGLQSTTGGFELQPGWSRTTPLDAPLSTVDLSSTSTPIFDSISVWFASDATGAGNEWAALDDGGWRAATARAAAEPQVAGVSEAGLPKRRPGANAVPSAAEVGPLLRGTFGEPPRPDAGQVRHRLDSFQQGVNTARRLRGRLSGKGDAAAADAAAADAAAAGAAVSPEPERPWDPLFDPMPARRVSDGQQRVAGTDLPTQQSAPEPAAEARTGDGRDDAAFRTFQREHMPQLLSVLLLEGAHPAMAAELAQEVFDEAYWNWATLQSPQDWVRERAMALLAHRRGSQS